MIQSANFPCNKGASCKICKIEHVKKHMSKEKKCFELPLPKKRTIFYVQSSCPCCASASARVLTTSKSLAFGLQTFFFSSAADRVEQRWLLIKVQKKALCKQQNIWCRKWFGDVTGGKECQTCQPSPIVLDVYIIFGAPQNTTQTNLHASIKVHFQVFTSADFCEVTQASQGCSILYH